MKPIKFLYYNEKFALNFCVVLCMHFVGNRETVECTFTLAIIISYRKGNELYGDNKL